MLIDQYRLTASEEIVIAVADADLMALHVALKTYIPLAKLSTESEHTLITEMC